MKVAISAVGDSLDTRVDPRFGRCGYFIIVETEDMGLRAFENESASLSRSAGIQSASFVASLGVQTVLTGNCGPKALDVLSAGGIEVFTGCSGTVRDAIDAFRRGALPVSAAGESGASESIHRTFRPVRKMGKGQCGGGGMGCHNGGRYR